MKTQQLEKRTAKTKAQQLADLAARLWPGPLPTWQKPTREKVLNDLPAWIIAIIICILANYLFLSATAHAQGSTAPPATSAASSSTGPSVAGVLSGLFGGLTLISLGAAIVGYFRPQLFQPLFKERTSKGVVAGSFGAAMLLFAMIGSSLEPKPVLTPEEIAAKSEKTKAQAETRIAQAKAAAAEARAEKAEAMAKAATQAKKVSDEKSNSSKTTQTTKGKDEGSRPHSQNDGDEKPSDMTENSSTSSSAENTGGEELPANVHIEDIKGIGKREVGMVDQVAYTITNIETGPNISDTRADGNFVVVHLVAVNTDKKTHDVTTALMKLLDDQDREFDPSSNGGMALVMNGDQSAQPFSAQVQPGVMKKLTLAYDVPSDASGLKLKIPAGTFSLDSDAVIRAPK